MATLSDKEQAIVDEARREAELRANRRSVNLTPVDISGTKWVDILKEAQEVDLHLSEDELRAKYAGPDLDGEHPIYTRADWREDVASESTLKGYWAWVKAWLEEDIAEEHLQFKLRKERDR